MCAWIVPPIAELFEPVPAPVIWVDGVAAVALDNGVLSIYSYSVKDPFHGDGQEFTLELVTKRSLITLPRDMCRVARALEMCFGAPPGRPPNGFVPRLVR